MKSKINLAVPFLILIILNSCTHKSVDRLPNSETSPVSNTSTIIEDTFKQKVDHENIKSKEVFEQHYAIEKAEVSPEIAPVLVVFMGTSDWVLSRPVYIRNFLGGINANIVAIDSRYMGKSIPVKSYSTENLKFKTTDQALADVAALIPAIKAKHNLNGKWVAYGHSYDSFLAYGIRLLQPNLVEGAIVDVSPLNAKFDLFQYDQLFAKLNDPSCSKVIRQGLAELEDVLKNDPVKFELFKKDIGAETLANPDDIMFAVSDIISAPLFYGHPGPVCDILSPKVPVDTAGDTAGDKLKRAIQFVGSPEGENYGPLYYSFGNISDESISAEFSGNRLFMYSLCSEYGGFQTAFKDVQVSLRSQRINLKYWQDSCRKVFGKKLPNNLNKFRQKYVSPLLYNSKLSNVIFTVPEYYLLFDAVPGVNLIKNKKVKASVSKNTYYRQVLQYSISKPPTLEVLATQNDIRTLLTKWWQLNP